MQLAKTISVNWELEIQSLLNYCLGIFKIHQIKKFKLLNADSSILYLLLNRETYTAVEKLTLIKFSLLILNQGAV